MNSPINGFDDTIAWYNANAQKYAQNIEDVPSLNYLDEFASSVGKNSIVLDAGCAAGRDTDLLRQRGLNATGLDLSKPLLAIARSKYPDLTFIAGNFLKLPFQSQTFDGVWAHASLLHLESTKEVSRALCEFNRVLRPGGMIHIFVKQQQGVEKTAIVSDKLSGHDRFFQWFSKNEMKHLLKMAHFTVLTIEDQILDPAGRDEVKWIRVLAKVSK